MKQGIRIVIQSSIEMESIMALFVRSEITPHETVTLNSEEVCTSLSQAYDLVRAIVEEDDGYCAAWKIGGSTPPAQKALGIDEIFFAPMHQKEIVQANGLVPGYFVLAINAECEVALRISANAEAYLEKGSAAVVGAPLADLFDSWCVSAEMPSGSLANAADFGVRAIVLDRCGSGALVLGPEHAYTEQTRWNGVQLKLEQDGEIIGEGSTDELVGPADTVARNFLHLALHYGFRPKPGQWVSTGAMVPCKPLKTDADIKIHFDGRIELAFKTGMTR